MSCFIMSPEPLAAIANTLEYILNSGFNRFGFDAPRSLHDALKDCRDRYGYYCANQIYDRLYRLNAAAYAGRYNRLCEDSIPPMPLVPILTQPRQYENHHESLKPWHFQFCKLLDCLIYQCSEDEVKKDPLYLSLFDFSHVYKTYLVCNTDLYASAKWGEL